MLCSQNYKEVAYLELATFKFSPGKPSSCLTDTALGQPQRKSRNNVVGRGKAKANIIPALEVNLHFDRDDQMLFFCMLVYIFVKRFGFPSVTVDLCSSVYYMHRLYFLNKIYCQYSIYIFNVPHLYV